MQKQGKNTREMNAGEKQIINENQKAALSKGKADFSLKKKKPEISNSFLQRIISLLKKEELI